MKINLLIKSLILMAIVFSSTKTIAQCDAIYADDDIILASVAQKLYRSTDGGVNFEHVLMAGEDNVEIRTITKVGNTLIAGGINWFIRVFKSTDNGATWSASNTGMPTIGTSQVAIPVASATVGTRVFMGGSNFAKYSDDEGSNWTDIPTVPTFTNAIKTTTGKMWHSSYQQIRCSEDNGATWTQITSPLFGGAAAVGYHEFPGKLIILSHLGGTQAVKQSLDGGATWATIGNLSGGLDMIEVNGDLFATSLDGLMKSEDEGQTWTNVCSDFQYYAYGGKMDFHNNILWVASNNGIIKYNNTTGDCELITIDPSLSVDENNSLYEINLYPNPAADQFTLSNLSGNSVISIYNSLGQLVTMFVTNKSDFKINISNFLSGVYHVEVYAENKVTKRKLIVNPNN